MFSIALLAAGPSPAQQPAARPELRPFGVVELTPAFELDGQGRNIDSHAFFEAPDPEQTLLFVSAKKNALVEVWRFPFAGREQPPLRHASFGRGRVNGLYVDQQADRLYVATSEPASRVSVFRLPELAFERSFAKPGVRLGKEPNLGFLELRGGRKRLYLSADDVVYIHDPATGDLVGEFQTERGLETIWGDDFHQRLYIPDENDRSGVYVYPVDAEGRPHPGRVERFGGDGIFQEDAEGILVYASPDPRGGDSGRGLIVVADQRQRQTDFEFFDRRSYQHLGTLRLTGVRNTDGIASTQRPLPGHPLGVFVALDDDATTVGLGWHAILRALRARP